MLAIFCKLFELTFIYKTLHKALRAGATASVVKNAFYRFLNSSNVDWRYFILPLARRVINDTPIPLPDKKRGNIFIVDGTTVYERNWSRRVELLGQIYDHS